MLGVNGAAVSSVEAARATEAARLANRDPKSCAAGPSHPWPQGPGPLKAPNLREDWSHG